MCKYPGLYTLMFGFHSEKNAVFVYLFFSMCAEHGGGIAIDMEILCLTKRTRMFSMFLFLFHFSFSIFYQRLSTTKAYQIVSHVKNRGKMTKFKIETNDPVCVRLTFPRTQNRIEHLNSKYLVYLCMEDKMEKRIRALYISLHIFPFIIIYGCCFGAYS